MHLCSTLFTFISSRDAKTITMYRFLLFLVIVISAEAFICNKHPRHCKHRRVLKQQRVYRPSRINPPTNLDIDQQFIDIATLLNDVHNQINNICSENVNNRTQELYGLEYFLKYRLPEYANGTISVKIYQQALLVKVVKEQRVFKDVRILPEILKVEEASWIYENEELKVVIPYKVASGREHQLSCNSGVSEVITVPMMENYNIHLRSIKESEKSNSYADLETIHFPSTM